MGLPYHSTRLVLVLATGLLAACTSPTPEPEVVTSPLAPVLEGMGRYHFPVSTPETDAQAFVDQGMVLAWGFNHAEAERSFLEAARLDPSCAMCWWGAALVLGPNINSGMDAEAVPRAWQAIERARALARHVEPRDQALIETLARRYGPAPVEDRSTLDVAWADGLRELTVRFPEDLDIAVLHAEARMTLHPWDYWQGDGAPQPWTDEIVDTLEAVLARAPDHPGANHLLIHALEASSQPERAVEAADRLGVLAPGAGHLVHMPSHIYIRVGRYDDAVAANQRAIEADDAYVTQCHAQGLYPLAYMPHNRHFLWFAATMTGQRVVAIEAAEAMAERIDPEMMRAPGMGTLQHFWITPLYAKVRFARWDDVLNHPEPDADLAYPKGVWHYARATALLRTGRLDEAAEEVEAVRAAAASPALEAVTIWDINGTTDLMAIAADVVAGELAWRLGDLDEARERLRAAAQREDALRYDEPPTWHLPVRHVLGEVLLASGDAPGAERVYREDLRRHPQNGWALRGLARSLERQGRDEDAAEAMGRFTEAWRGEVGLVSAIDLEATVPSG